MRLAGDRYDEIFGKRKRRPGRVTMVMRDGHLVEGHARKADNKSFASESLGCGVGQVAEFNRTFGGKGVKFDPEGRAIFKDRHAKLSHMRERGFIDHDEVRSGRNV